MDENKNESAVDGAENNASQNEQSTLANVEQNEEQGVLSEESASAFGLDKLEKRAKKEQKKSRKERLAEQEEQRKQEIANLSDDELYAKVQTEKLLKRKKTRKIATLSTLCVIFVIALCVIVMAIVPVSLKVSCLGDDFSSVKMYNYDSSNSIYSVDASISDDDSRYSTFMKYYNKSFNQSVLNALFSGSLFSYEIDEVRTSVNNTKDTDSFISNVLDGENFIQFSYDEEQTLTYQNGKTFSSYYSTNKWDGTLTFTTAYLVLNEEEGIQDTNIYVIAKYVSSIKDGVTNYAYYLVEITVKADTSILYENWDAITDL